MLNYFKSHNIYYHYRISYGLNKWIEEEASLTLTSSKKLSKCGENFYGQGAKYCG